MNNQKLSGRWGTPSKAQHNPVLSLVEPSRTKRTDPRSSDPYNTSGSFDRKKNWAQVGKR